MKHITRRAINRNVLKVLIHPHTTIYLRFCCFVARFITPISCNKIAGGMSAKKTGPIALENIGGVCYGILTPGYIRYNHYSVLYNVYNVITFCVRPDSAAICYRLDIISTLQPNKTLLHQTKRYVFPTFTGLCTN